MASAEELQGIVAGLLSVVKDLIQKVNHISTQIGQLATTSQQAPQNPPSASPAQPPQSLRLPTLQLPTFRCDESSRDDIADFLERFEQQTSHLSADITVTLLEQQCIGEWPRSVLSIAKTTADFAGKPAKEQLATFIEHLKREFEEPTALKRRRLAAELSAMTQKASENVNQFTFRFRNVLHQMERLGEKVAKDCPTYVVSQFLAKVKPEIAQQLVLKAEEFTTLEQAAESARRIELSLQTQTRGDVVSRSENLDAWKPSNALFTSSGKSNSSSPQQRGKKRHCWTCGSPNHLMPQCPSSQRATQGSKLRTPEVCRNCNRYLHSNCERANNKCSRGHLHKCSTCHKWGCKTIRHDSQQANAATPTKPPDTPSTNPDPSGTVLFGLPAFTDPTALPVNTQTQLANRNILWTSVTSADQSIPLPLDSCCSVSLVSADHATAIITKRPSLQYKKLSESIPVSVDDANSNLSATATVDVPITWSNCRESIFTMLVVPHLS